MRLFDHGAFCGSGLSGSRKNQRDREGKKSNEAYQQDLRVGTTSDFSENYLQRPPNSEAKLKTSGKLESTASFTLTLERLQSKIGQKEATDAKGYVERHNIFVWTGIVGRRVDTT